jgi:hypothetical protein
MIDPSLPARNRLIPHDEVVAYVQMVADLVGGRTPTRIEWYLLEPHPRGLGRVGLAKRYGTWSKAMAACGFTPRLPSETLESTPGMDLRRMRMSNRRMVSGGYRGSGGPTPQNDRKGPA